MLLGIYMGVVMALVPASALQGSTTDLEVIILGAEARGKLRVALFDSQKAFDADAPTQKLTLEASNPAQAIFHGLLPSRYGVAVYQDMDEDGKLDKNFLGIPREPHGFSNGAKGRFGPPAFQAFSIALPESGASIEVKID